MVYDSGDKLLKEFLGALGLTFDDRVTSIIIDVKPMTGIIVRIERYVGENELANISKLISNNKLVSIDK